MSDTDDKERDLRLELMRLDRKLKLRDLRRWIGNWSTNRSNCCFSRSASAVR